MDTVKSEKKADDGGQSPKSHTEQPEVPLVTSSGCASGASSIVASAAAEALKNSDLPPKCDARVWVGFKRSGRLLTDPLPWRVPFLETWGV